jgi:hypothetical protein
MEKQTIHRAFGYVIFRNEVGPSVVSENHGVVNKNIYSVEKPFSFDFDPSEYTKEKYNHVWLYTEGKVRSTNIETGDFFEKSAGYCTVDDPHPLGTFRVEFLEPTVFYCLGPEANLKRTPIIPKVKPLRLSQGESVKFDKQTRIFVCSGTLNMRGVIISDICQLTVNESTELIAETSVYGLIFE